MFKAKIITSLVAIGLISSAILGLLLYYVLPQFYSDWYFEVLLFFLVLETALVSFVISGSKTATSKKMVNVYLLSKVVKMLASLVFVAIYMFAVKENIRNFILTFIAFYAIYLGIETFLFSKIEHHLKETKKSDE